MSKPQPAQTHTKHKSMKTNRKGENSVPSQGVSSKNGGPSMLGMSQGIGQSFGQSIGQNTGGQLNTMVGGRGVSNGFSKENNNTTIDAW